MKRSSRWDLSCSSTVRGNYEGPHDHDILFAKVAPILVKPKPMALVVEAANPRHAHEWAVWQEVKLPDDKILVPGVLDTSTNYVEPPSLSPSASASLPTLSAASG